MMAGFWLKRSGFCSLLCSADYYRRTVWPQIRSRKPVKVKIEESMTNSLGYHNDLVRPLTQVKHTGLKGVEWIMDTPYDNCTTLMLYYMYIILPNVDSLLIYS